LKLVALEFRPFTTACHMIRPCIT